MTNLTNNLFAAVTSIAVSASLFAYAIIPAHNKLDRFFRYLDPR